MRRRCLVLAAAVGLAAAPAPRPAAAEPFLDLFGGRSATQDADIRVRQPALGHDYRFEDVAFDDASFRSPIYYGLRAGYVLGGPLGVGAAIELVHFKVIADTGERRRLAGTRGGVPVDAEVPVESIIQGYQISHGVNYLTADLFVRRGLLGEPGRFPNGRLQLYAGLGVGPVIAHPEISLEGVKLRERYEVAGIGGQVFAGLRLYVWRYVGLMAEYKFSYSDLEVDVPGGTSRLGERTHHLVGGLTLALPAF